MIMSTPGRHPKGETVQDRDRVLCRLAGGYGRAVEMPAELRGELDAMFRSGGLGVVLGFRLVGWEPGRAVVELRPTAAVANITGSVHGGVLYTAADAAFEVACNSYGRLCVALDVSVHHASAAPLEQPVVAEAVEVSRSARVASYRITATGADGEVRAWYQATAYRTSRWHFGEDRWPDPWRAAH
jgi:acyl-CoA thioesterase